VLLFLVKPFLGLNYQEKLEVKRLGPHQPDLKFEQSSKDRGKEYTRKFTTAWYEKKKWLCGSASRKSLFCFPCLLFGFEVAWTQTGVNDLKHLSEKNQEMLIMQVPLRQLNKAGNVWKCKYCNTIGNNDEVDKNRYFLSKFYDAFELALRSDDETESSLNPGVFRGLADLVSSIDSAMEKHVKTATVFKGTSKTIQNELLDMTRNFIIQQLRSTEYVATQADDTTDVSILVYRYIDGNSKVVERFYGFTHLKDSCAESFATALLDQLNIVFSEHCDKQKLIAQSYDGASAKRGESGGVQGKVRDRYLNAHYVHCYAHQLNLIMEQGFLAFFLHSPKRTEVLDAIVVRRLPKGAGTSILGQLIWSTSTKRISLNALRQSVLNASSLSFFFFYDIMPHVDVLYSQLQTRNIDSICERVTTEFISSINKVWESIEDLGSKLPDEPSHSRMEIKTMKQVAQEVRDIIIVHAKQYFAFTKHLVSAKLLQSDLFKRQPQALTDTVQAYPMLNKERLHTELSVIYRKSEFHGAMALFWLFLENNLQDTFSETEVIVILITTPMTTVESERCFSTLKRIKTLRNTTNQDRLNALTMPSMEKQLIQEIPDFNKRTIEKFAALKDRWAKFLYK
uniref:DUF4371 domain-containing protein n=1 Tax=Latimeria chalumnae TaxID=7897 RepID=H3AGF5_LATCH